MVIGAPTSQFHKVMSTGAAISQCHKRTILSRLKRNRMPYNIPIADTSFYFMWTVQVPSPNPSLTETNIVRIACRDRASLFLFTIKSISENSCPALARNTLLSPKKFGRNPLRSKFFIILFIYPFPTFQNKMPFLWFHVKFT